MRSSSNPDSDDYDNGSSLSGRAAPKMSECVLLLNRQRAERADWDEIRGFLARLSAQMPAPGFTVCLLSDAAIRRYNRQFRGLDKATDVLSFPAEEPSGEAAYLGDVLISAETARHNARRFGLRLEEEIELLALHGVLHLLGHDHDRDGGEMARLERNWSRRLGLPQNLTGRARSGAPGRNGKRRLGR
jgi:probable rRNA maturation factor